MMRWNKKLHPHNSTTKPTLDRAAETDSEATYLLHVNAAKSFRARGRTPEALTRFRRALRSDPSRTYTWIDYGHAALAMSWHSVAYEAFLNALDLDPSNVEALEIYLDVATALKVPKQVARRKVRNAFNDAASHPKRHLDILDFAIPFGVSSLATYLETATDPRVNALIQMNLQPSTEAPNVPPELTDDQARDVLTRLHVLRGRFSAAEKLLSSTPPSKYPVPTLRRTMKRISDQGRHAQAKMLATSILRADPTNSLAKIRWERSEQAYRASEVGIEKRELLDGGFPIPPSAPRTHERRNRSALYLLHNSLPYNSAGYATRSHGLITQIRNSGIDIAGVTRPGYPFDRPEAKVDGESIPDIDTVDGTPYHRLTTIPEKLPKVPLIPYVYEYAQRVEALAKRENSGLIHAASNHWNGLAATIAARRLGIPSVYEVRGLWEITRISREPSWKTTLDYEFMAGMETEAANSATRVLAITQALKNEMVSRGVDAGKIHIIPNGVDTSRFIPREPDAALKNSLGLDGKLIVGYVGSVLDYEGIDTLIDAARLLTDMQELFHVLIIGDGAYIESAKIRAVENGVSELVTFLGRIPHDEVERYYSIIDVAPIPRHSLPVTEMVSPLKPFEAMAMGKVVLGSDVEAIQEIIQPGENGLLFRKDSPSDLARIVSEILDNPKIVEELGRSARDWVVRERDWKILASQVVEVYDDLL